MLMIGKMGQCARVKMPTIRSCEEIGLLPGAQRSAGNQRLYTRRRLERLTFTRHARELGVPLDAVRQLLSLSDRPDQSCAAADVIARAQLAAVAARISRLTALRTAAAADGGAMRWRFDCQLSCDRGAGRSFAVRARPPRRCVVRGCGMIALSVFAAAALAEIAGRFVVWAWLRQRDQVKSPAAYDWRRRQASRLAAMRPTSPALPES